MQILVYDGTFCGFLTVINLLFLGKKPLDNVQIENSRITRIKSGLFTEKIISKPEIAKNFYEYLRKNLPIEFFKKIYLYYLCDTAKIEISLIRVLKEIEKNPIIWKNITHTDVNRLYQVEKNFRREKHRYLGVLRFIELPERILFSWFEPKFNILPCIYKHFINRFPNENFIIFDNFRKLIFIYLKKKMGLFFVDNLEIEISYNVDPFISFWRTYLKEISIPERINFERQRNRLPLKLRKYLPEFQEI